MADMIAQINDSRTPQNPGDGSQRGGGRWRGVALTTILLVVATSTYLAWQYSRDCDIERRLTGSWVSNVIHEDGSEDPFVWQFLPDGTMQHHPKGKPFAGTASDDNSMGWHVSGGRLVLTFDHQFPHEASLVWKAKHAIVYLREIATGKYVPLALQDRCLFNNAGRDSIELSLDPNENALDSWFGGGTCVLTRTSDNITTE